MQRLYAGALPDQLVVLTRPPTAAAAEEPWFCRFCCKAWRKDCRSGWLAAEALLDALPEDDCPWVAFIRFWKSLCRAEMALLPEVLPLLPSCEIRLCSPLAKLA